MSIACHTPLALQLVPSQAVVALAQALCSVGGRRYFRRQAQGGSGYCCAESTSASITFVTLDVRAAGQKTPSRHKRRGRRALRVIAAGQKTTPGHLSGLQSEVFVDPGVPAQGRRHGFTSDGSLFFATTTSRSHSEFGEFETLSSSSSSF